MPRGVRNPQELAGLNLSQRLIVRVGALLKKNLALTPAVLETVAPGSPLENFLLSPELLERGGNLDGQALAQLNAAGASGAALACAAAGDGVRVLCLQEELDAGEGWSGAGNALATAGDAVPSALAPLSSASSRRARAPEEEGAALFGPAELDRLRLKIMTATASAERIEAMRTLALAPLQESEKAGLLLQGLSDKDAAVRAEAANLLPALGVSRDFAGTLAALNHPAFSHRLAAVERLIKLLGRTPQDLDAGATAVCALATVKTETDQTLVTQLLKLLGQCAPALGRNSARVLEVSQVMLEMLAAAAKQGSSAAELERLAGPIQRLLAALGSAAPQVMLPVLYAERERSSDPVIEGLLLQLLLDLTPGGSADEDRLVEMAVAFLARDKEEGRVSRAVSARVLPRGEKTVLAICAAFQRATHAAQKYFILLLDDCARMHRLSPASLERAAQVLLWTMETGGKGLRMDAMHCRLAASPEISEGARKKLADAFLNSISDFTFPFDKEKVENIVVRIGLPAVEPLVKRLAPACAPEQRNRAVRLLGELSLSLKVSQGQLAQARQAFTSVLRRLEAVSLEEDFPDRGLLLCALGKIVSSPAAEKEAGDVVERTLLDAAESDVPRVSALALEGLAYLASSRRAQPHLVAETARLLRRMLDELVFDISMNLKKINGEAAVEVTGGEKYITFLPIILKGLTRVAGAPNCPPALARELARLLNERWQRVRSGDLIWGPANTLLLVQALRDLACGRAFPSDLRLEIIKGLAPKYSHTPVMHALTEILAADDSAVTAAAAMTIGQALLGRKNKTGQFEEDREDILKALTRVAGRRYLGAGADSEAARAFRVQVIDELFKALKDQVPGCYEALAALRDAAGLSPDLRADIERRLREYHSLAVQ